MSTPVQVRLVARPGAARVLETSTPVANHGAVSFPTFSWRHRSRATPSASPVHEHLPPTPAFVLHPASAEIIVAPHTHSSLRPGSREPRREGDHDRAHSKIPRRKSDSHPRHPGEPKRGQAGGVQPVPGEAAAEPDVPGGDRGRAAALQTWGEPSLTRRGAVMDHRHSDIA